jgi:hypothetical protein
MKRSAAHQAAVDVANHTQRQSLAYHHALKAVLDKTAQRVGSIYDNGDSYVWLIAFSPRMRDAVIVETFKNRDGQDSMRTFWLDDMRDGIKYADLRWQELFSKAVQMQNEEYAKAA